MFSLAIRSLKAKRSRFLLTAVAVVLGVAFMTGTLVLTDTIRKVHDDVAADVYDSTDAVVRSARHVENRSTATDVRGTVDAAVLDRVRATEGVAAAEGVQSGVAVVVGHDGELVDGNPNRPVPRALGWPSTAELNPMEVVSGHAPRGRDEVVVDRATQRKGHLVVGETVDVVGPSGARPYRLAGVVTYGGADSAAGAQVVAFAPATAAEVLGTPGRYSAVQVVAEPGVSQAALVAHLEAALREPGIEVVSGAEAAADAREASGASLQFVGMFLTTFALVALVVGAFVIHNSFSITVAQRTRETALLRAVGAGRKQVTRPVVVEAALTGVLASAVGVVAGIGMTVVLRRVLEAFGMTLPGAAMVVQGRTIAVSAVIGVVVTVLAAYLPARRAGKVPPIEALRDVAIEPSRGARWRSVLGALVALGGGAAMARGLAGAVPAAVGLGGFGVFIGVAMLGPAIARPFARIVGRPLGRTRGIVGLLARENAARNPRRTARTASALMIGVGLVAMITVFAASARTSAAVAVDDALKGDFIVDTRSGMGGLSPRVAREIEKLPEVAAVTPLRYTNATVDGRTRDVTAVDPATVESTAYTNMKAGSLSHLGPHTVAVQADVAEKRRLHVGDTVTIGFPETGAQRMRVVGVYGTKTPFGSFMISLDAFDANVATRVDDHVAVSIAPGVSVSAARSAIDEVLDGYPTAQLLDHEEFKGVMADQIDQMLNLVYVLLAMAVVIALFGIANTLALSVLERTRELGLLRAVGMDRGQVRSAVRWESVLIALLGTSLGTLIGVGFSWVLVEALADQGFVLALPAGRLVGIVALFSVAAVAVAALPARRAARLPVLEAVSR